MIDLNELRVIIVEDDPIISTDLRGLLLEEGISVVGVAKNALKAFDMLHSLQPNFAILDIHLGTGPSGIEIAELIHDKYQFPYIFLTSFSDPETLAAAREQGPFGYLVKPFQDRTLLTTISVAWSNYTKMASATKIKQSELLSILTPQEKSICNLLVKGNSYKQICSDLFISMNTLKYHVKNIYEKLDIRGRSELTALLLQ